VDNVDYRRPNDDEYEMVGGEAGWGSFYSQAGVGFKYKINRRFDAELKGTYYMTGDEEFDGSGDTRYLPGGTNIYSAADIEEGRDDKPTASLITEAFEKRF
jgi:OOP family OmpA-OmpF porin